MNSIRDIFTIKDVKMAKHLICIFLFPIFFSNCPTDEKNSYTIREPVLITPLPVTDYDPVNTALKNRIVTYLSNVGDTNQILIGQNVGSADWSGTYYYESYMQDIFNLTGKKPAILGIDLGFQDYSSDYSSMIGDIEEHWTNGGLITLSVCIPNPKTTMDVWDKDFNSADYNAILTEGTDIRRRWKVILSNIANILQKLKEKNLIILWRPLHEINGGWFWWANSSYPPTKENVTALWKDMYNYFYTERKLDNLIWVYNANYKYVTEQPDTDYYYPGDDYADVVGLDYYCNDMANMNMYNSYDKLAALGKPFAVCEIGSIKPMPASYDNNIYLEIKTKYPKTAYMLKWHSWTNNYAAIHHTANASSFMNNALILTLSNVNY